MPDEPSFDELRKMINNPYSAASGVSGQAGGEENADVIVRNNESYWEQSRQPLTSLLFILPFLAVYEFGVLWQSAESPRNGAEVWMRQFLGLIHLGDYYFLLPLLMIVVLLGWQHLTHRPWKVSKGVLTGMLLESLILAVVLIGIAKLQNSWFPFQIQGNPAGDTLEIGASSLPTLSIGEWMHRLVSYFGAGVYEEMLFRLILLPACASVLINLGVKGQASWLWAAVLTSVLFAAAHHVGSLGEAWAIRPLLFRSIAGMFFSLLFLFRGFGICVGTHALYDIMVGLM
jgi:membrane protease YdiL (CAAX protease family)